MRAQRVALIAGCRAADWGDFDRRVDRVAAALQRDGLGRRCDRDLRERIDRLCGRLSRRAAGRCRRRAAGAGIDRRQPGRMIADAGARLLFRRRGHRSRIRGAAADPRHAPDRARRRSAGRQRTGALAVPDGTLPAPVELPPSAPFNIIYSSGTTGEPKGIVQPHGMRWSHVRRGAAYGYGPDDRDAAGDAAVFEYDAGRLLPDAGVRRHGRADAEIRCRAAICELAERLRVTHTMLVPVQYQRLMAHADFDRHDLGSFEMQFSTSAPFAAALKADVLRRWPGGLIEFYGMTEGGGTCILEAHAASRQAAYRRPAGRRPRYPADRRRRQRGRPRANRARSSAIRPGMMSGYHGQPDKTRDAEWLAPGRQALHPHRRHRPLRRRRLPDPVRPQEGHDHLRRLQYLPERSGGAAAQPSGDRRSRRSSACRPTQWGETPVAYVVRRRRRRRRRADALLQLVQRPRRQDAAAGRARLVDELPRSAIGKVLKRDLRSRAGPPSATRPRRLMPPCSTSPPSAWSSPRCWPT